jgi:general secretion pathway protein G
MNKAGFTLIEIIVTMAIMSILAGALVPMVYRVWESNEIALTRARMADLKTAIAGDPNLYQQGIRSDYGFVGDIGDLPDTLDDLISDSGAWIGWNGSYLPGGSDPVNFMRDAWGRDIVYSVHSPPLLIAGKEVAATLRSAGPDGNFGTADDIDENSALELQILSKDVWPTASIRGNLNITLTATTEVTPVYYANLRATYRTGSGVATASTGCIGLNIGLVQSGVAKTVAQAIDTSFPLTLPIGQSTLRSRLFSDADCSLLLEETNDMAIFVSDGLRELSVNPPMLYYRID